MSEILTKDDFMNGKDLQGTKEVRTSEERQIAIEKIMSALNDLEELKDTMFNQKSIASISFTFGTYYIELKRKLENALYCLEK